MRTRIPVIKRFSPNDFLEEDDPQFTPVKEDLLDFPRATGAPPPPP